MHLTGAKRAALALGGALLLIAIATAAAAAGGGRHKIDGSKPQWEANTHFKQIGTVPDGKRVSAKVWLAPNDQAALESLAQAVSDPGSSQYGAFLTHDQYVSRFAPTQAQLASVEQWLHGAGLNVGAVGPDNHYVAVTGSASAIAAAFGTQLGLFEVEGKQVQAPTSDLSVPDSVGGLVLAVTGLTPVGHVVTPADLGAPDAFVNATPCSAYYGEKVATTLPKFKGKFLPYAPCGYTPQQLRGAYGVTDSHLTGAGQTVAITDAFDAPTLQSDASTYAVRHGDPAFGGGQFSDRSAVEGDSTNPDPINACGGNGWYGEQTLDVEAVHAMAPAANVVYYGAASCYDDDLLAKLAQATEEDDASIVTNSWGEPTVIANDPADGCTEQTPCLTIDQTLVDAYHSVIWQGAVEGIGFYFSSGDAGDEGQNAGYVHPDFPAGDPWVTAVGGTSLGVDSSNQRLFETGWGTSRWDLNGSSWTQTVPFLYGAGGGFSQIFQEPWYQKGSVKHDPTGGRAVPDISMDGDPTTGMLVGETQSFAGSSVFGGPGVHYGEYRVGGTSLSSPLLAGAQAVAQQGARLRIGFANPLIYDLDVKLHGQPTYYDPTRKKPDLGNIRSDFINGENADGGIRYTVRTFDQDSSLNAKHGWDDVTGLGTVTKAYFDRLSQGSR
ncbi:MAG TPA: S53 family peptidase [Gaiellaceae bacterium]|nr:S53 family peptidase [Gaiellaceae bacterium]